MKIRIERGKVFYAGSEYWITKHGMAIFLNCLRYDGIPKDSDSRKKLKYIYRVCESGRLV